MQSGRNIVLGTRRLFTPVREELVPFSLSPEARMHHVYVVGMTGVGKSTLIDHMVAQDMHLGHGLTHVDFHGDSSQRLLDFVPSWRVNDVVVLNPADLARPVGLNVTERVPRDEIASTVGHIVAAFKKLFDSWGPQLEWLLTNAVRAQVELESGTLLGVYRMFIDRDYRLWVADRIEDPMVRVFWREEFEAKSSQWQAEASASVLNKIGQFVGNPVIRNIVGTVRSTIDFKDIMDHRRILLVNLSKGLLDAPTANLLGSLLISKLQATAMARAKLSPRRRVDHFLYIDEFQNLSTKAFADILSEARKYRLSLTLAHQYMDQLSEEVREAVLGNVGNIISFRVGYEDAEVLEKAFGKHFPARRFVELGESEVLARLHHSSAGEPFAGSTVVYDEQGSMRHPLAPYQWGRGGTIVKRSRKIYGGRRRVREAKIRRFLARPVIIRKKKRQGKQRVQ